MPATTAARWQNRCVVSGVYSFSGVSFRKVPKGGRGQKHIEEISGCVLIAVILCITRYKFPICVVQELK